MTKRILVTGATGFIGRAVILRLQQDGWSVRVAVRQETPLLPGAQEQIVTGDLADGAADWGRAVTGCEAVLHLAGLAHVLDKNAARQVELFHKINVEATKACARASLAAGVKRFVFVSSIGVHGTRNEKPFTEDSPFAPTTPYAATKAEAERALIAMTAETSMEYVGVRPPLVYGPNARGNFERLYQLIKTGLPLPLGTATHPRSMIGLGNLADFLALVTAHPQAAGQTFVIADAKTTSVKELIGQLARLSGRKARLFPFPTGLLHVFLCAMGRKGMADGLFAGLTVDTARARDVLGWVPPLTQEEELRRVVEADV